MNPVLAILIVIAVLGLVLLGGPSEKTRKGFGKKDALVSAIEEYNEKSKQSAFGFKMPQSQPQPLRPNGAPAPHFAPYMMKSPQDNPYAAGNPYTNGQQQPQQGQPQQPSANPDSYYPPPPISGSQPASPLQPPAGPRSDAGPGSGYQVPMTLPPQPNTDFKLGDGTPVRFAGIDVYTFDAKGRPMAMPDGEYPMYNGLVQLVVRDGKRIILRDSMD